MSVTPALRPDRDWHKTVATILAVGGVLYAAGGKLMDLGAEKSEYERLKQMGDDQIHVKDDVSALKYQVRDLAGAQTRAEQAQTKGFEDLNAQLKSLRITGRR